MAGRGLRALAGKKVWRTFAFALTGAGVLAGAGLGAGKIYQHFGVRTIGVCVATDFAYREARPNWRSQLQPLFATVNRMFEGTGVRWRAWEGGEAYTPEAALDAQYRSRMLANQPPCEADVVLGLTGQSDPHLNSVTQPFAHTLLVELSERNTPVISATILARSLARLFGVPGSAQALVLADSAGAIFDASAVRIIHGMRNYDFSQGIAGLSGGVESRAVDALAAGLAGKDPHPQAEAHRIVAQAFASALRHDDSVREFQAALRLNPQDSGLRFELGMELAAASRTDEAISELEAVAAADKSDAKPHAAMGAILLNARRVDEAIDQFLIATRMDPRDASYHAALGQAYSMQPGRTREASAAFEESMRLKPAEPGAYAGLERENGVQQALEESARRAQAEANQNPASPDAHFKLAVAQAYAGNTAAARKEIERVLQIQPDNAAAHLVMARLDYIDGQYRAAQAELETARAKGAPPTGGLAETIRRKLAGGSETRP